jgi:hypothetical protein
MNDETLPLVMKAPLRNYSTLEAGAGLFVEPCERDTLSAQVLHQVAHDIHEFGIIKERLNWFLIYIMAILLYLGLNGALLVANSFDQEFIEEHYELPMHYLSFWGVFLFTVVEAVLLISTGVVRWENKGKSTIILFDVCLSFFSALLYTLDPEVFEVPCHYVEYLVQIPITCVNLIFVNQTMNTTGLESKESITTRISRWTESGSSHAVLLLSVFQLLLYSSFIPVNMGNERSAHFCEFTNELVNGIFALKYAIVCYNEWKNQLDQHKI